MYREMLFRCIGKYYSISVRSSILMFEGILFKKLVGIIPMPSELLFLCFGRLFQCILRNIIPIHQELIFKSIGKCDTNVLGAILPVHWEIVFQYIDNDFPKSLVIILQCFGKCCSNVLWTLVQCFRKYYPNASGNDI